MSPYIQALLKGVKEAPRDMCEPLLWLTRAAKGCIAAAAERLMPDPDQQATPIK